MTLTEYFADHAQLRREWASDKNTISSDTLASSARTKVWWRCDHRHEWQATPASRISMGRGCPYCAKQIVLPGENDLLTTAPETVMLWHPTRNGSLAPDQVMPGSNKRLWWQCERGHEWQARIFTIKKGGACPYCFGRYAIPGETDLATTHPHVLKFWSDRNTLLPTEVTASSQKRAWWICEKGHEWDALVGSVVTDGCGCPYCSGKRAIPGETDLKTLHPELMEQWDFEKNDLDPTQVTVASHDKVWWKCALGHSWTAVVFSRTKEKASGCPYCTGRQVLAGFNDLATLNPGLAEQWYQPLNGALQPEAVTLGSNKKVWWQCGAGHVWQAFIYARAKPNGTGCPICAGRTKQRGNRAATAPQPKPKIHRRKKTEHSAERFHV